MFCENTPLVSGSSPLTYTPPYRQWVWDENAEPQHNADSRTLRMREYYNSVFCAGGADVALQDVAVVQCSVFHRCFPTLCSARICCQGVSAEFQQAGLHLVTDVDGIAGAALLDAVSGRKTCASGDIWINGIVTDAPVRRYQIAAIGMGMLLIPQLTVEDHLWCMVHLHKKERRSWKREMVLAAANFTGLDTRRQVSDLGEMEKFRLQVALELVLDPPTLLFYYSFDVMSLVQQLEATELLCRLARVIKKTVVLCTRSLPMHLFSAATSLLLLGSNGLVLYSGRPREAIPYFNQLHIPSSIPEPLWKALLTPTREVSTAADDADASSSSVAPPLTAALLSTSAQHSRAQSESRLYSAMCTPPRLSSRFVSAHFHDGFAQLLAPPAPPTVRGTPAVVEVSTSGDLVDLVAEWAESEAQTMYYAAKYYDSPVHAALAARLGRRSTHNESEALAPRPPRTAPNSLWKFGTLLLYSLKQVTADAELVTGIVSLSVGLTFVAVLAHAQPESQGGMYNIRGLIFTAFTLVLFTNLVTMERAGDQLRLAVAHIKRRLYGVTSFIVCLSVRILLIRSVYLALFIPYVVFVLKSSYALALLVWCVGCSHAALHYVIAAIFPSRWSTVRVWYGVFAFNIIRSGFLLNLHTVPAMVSSLSFARWGYGAVLHTWLHGKAFECDGANNTSYCYTGDEYLVAQGFRNDTVAIAAVVLSTWGVGLMVVLGCVLYLKSL